MRRILTAVLAIAFAVTGSSVPAGTGADTYHDGMRTARTYHDG